MEKDRRHKTTGGQDEAVALDGFSSRFYQNRRCEYFPCHDMERDRLNCLFCYCPLYHSRCPGQADIARVGDKEVKDCSRCDFPHRPENFDTVVEHILTMLHVRD